MSRYNSNNGGSSNGNNNGDYDDTTLKLQKYAALRLELDNLNANGHDQYGTSFITNYDAAEVIDGIVFQRDDKPGTWKVFSADKFFNLNPEDGLVYESFTDDGGYTGQMSAQDILDHPRVAGFSESFGGNDYFYTPVGVVIEEAGDIATNDSLDVETTDEPTIEVGEASMLLGNKSWTRTLAKKLSAEGDIIISDNGDEPTPRGEPDTNPKYDNHEWLATEDPTLRDDLDGRSLELWVTEETNEWDDGEETTFTVPNVMDVKTGEFIEIDNGLGEDSESDTDANNQQETAADGGTVTDTSSDTTDTESTESTDEPSASTDDDSGLPEGVPEKLDDLIGYMARKGDSNTADDVRNFAEDEVENPDDIDWEAAADEANKR